MITLRAFLKSQFSQCKKIHLKLLMININVNLTLKCFIIYQKLKGVSLLIAALTSALKYDGSFIWTARTTQHKHYKRAQLINLQSCYALQQCYSLILYDPLLSYLTLTSPCISLSSLGFKERTVEV